MLRHALARRSYATVAASAPIPTSPIVHLPLTQWPSRASIDTGTDVASAAVQYVALPSHIFGAPPRPDILHQCVVTHLASLRQGTASTKGRSEVKASGRKLYRQKGTGKARVGDAASPTRRGGGHAFAKKPKDWSLGLNRKVFEMGIRTALSERWRRNELSIIPEAPRLPLISTRSLVDSFRTVNSSFTSSLFLLSEIPTSFELSARNLPNLDIRLVEDADVYTLLQYKRIVMDLEAVQFLQDWLGKSQDTKLYEEHANRSIETATLRKQPLNISMADVEALMTASSTCPSPSSSVFNQDSTNPDGGVKKHDIVIEQEEAPVQEQRYEDVMYEAEPLKNHDGIVRDGDRLREQMQKVSSNA